MDFDFIEGSDGGQFVLVGGPLVQLRQLLAKGDIEVAVKTYEDTGGAARDGLLAEASTASFETKRGIAQLFRRARDFAAAARAFQFARLETEAATDFEQAGEFLEAAACWNKAGEVLKAAAAYERAGKIDEALELYRKGGATERAAECLARGGRYLEAAQAFRTLKNTHAEVETLRAGLNAEPTNVELAARLAELMVHHGRKDHAAQLLVDTAKRSPAAKDHPRFLTLLAAALDFMGNAPAAANVRARLQALPKDASAPAVAEAPPAPATAPELGPDAYGFLKALPMFANLALPDMKALYRLCTLHTFSAGQHVIETGHAGRGLFVIVDGQVEVYAGPDASSRLLNTLGVGGYVGEISLVQDGPTSARVTARTPVKALFISRESFLEYIYGFPAAALRIYQLFTFNLAERVRVLSAAR
ncbi:MAG: tetratricopeptide repeat protein [Archangium sp.]|nr:tetratricopeptide repeat protein [Archangium sp.]